ncbi:hypothetical protein BDW59DRAFT_153205 [Aspergillus cavernicola]|uniref:Uncharacterized protein n=1 Tax=Aspergillus cavernicola TaxID=176166 RepID=A0ABR4HNX1_9EURO
MQEIGPLRRRTTSPLPDQGAFEWMENQGSHDIKHAISGTITIPRPRRPLVVEVRMQPHQASPPIGPLCESVVVWRSDNDAGNGSATSPSLHEAFLLLACRLSYPG